MVHPVFFSLQVFRLFQGGEALADGVGTGVTRGEAEEVAIAVDRKGGVAGFLGELAEGDEQGNLPGLLGKPDLAGGAQMLAGAGQIEPPFEEGAADEVAQVAGDGWMGSERQERLGGGETFGAGGAGRLVKADQRERRERAAHERIIRKARENGELLVKGGGGLRLAGFGMLVEDTGLEKPGFRRIDRAGDGKGFGDPGVAARLGIEEGAGVEQAVGRGGGGQVRAGVAEEEERGVEIEPRSGCGRRVGRSGRGSGGGGKGEPGDGQKPCEEKACKGGSDRGWS